MQEKQIFTITGDKNIIRNIQRDILKTLNNNDLYFAIDQDGLVENNDKSVDDRIEAYKKAQEYFEKEAKQKVIFEHLKEKNHITRARSLDSFDDVGYILMDENKNEEENNKIFVSKFVNNKTRDQYISEIVKDAFNIDYSELIVNDKEIKKTSDTFFKDPKKFVLLQNLDNFVKPDLVNPVLKDIYNHNKPMFIQGGDCFDRVKLNANIFSLLIPLDLTGKLGNLKQCKDQIVRCLDSYKHHAELEDKDIEGMFDDYVKQVEANQKMVNRNNIKAKIHKKDKEFLDKDFAKTGTLIHKPAKGKEEVKDLGKIKSNETKEYFVADIDPESQKHIAKALEGDIIFDYDKLKALDSKSTAVAERMNTCLYNLEKSKGIFTWDSKQFKTLLKVLNEYNKEFKNLNETSKSERVKLHDSCKDKVLKSLNDYIDYKETQEKNGKKLNERSQLRLENAKALRDSFMNNDIENELYSNTNKNKSQERKNIIVEEAHEINTNQIELNKSIEINLDKNKDNIQIKDRNNNFGKHKF